jgi:hypothetical protein
MMKRSERRLREQLRSQLEQERNGKPIDPQMRVRMTKPKDPEQLYQVMVMVRATKQMVPLGPMMNKDACGISAEAVNRQILTSGRFDWSKAEVVPMTPISQGA